MLHQNNNGNFLGLIEMLEVFDPFIKEHVRRITSEEVHVHYLGHNIQNDLIQSPRTNVILRYVNVSSTCVSVEESFLGFLNVDDTTSQGLFDVTQAELKVLDLDIDDVYGQGYDNRSNMKGKHHGVQKKFLDINPRAF
ncbi:zinc finger MYM-type protein 1-like protein [Tanacetum coccineum]